MKEAIDLTQNGLMFENKLFKISFEAFVLDAPAKSFILGVKGHTGYSSCTRCWQSGKWIEHCMVFPNLDGLPRANEEFLNQIDEDFHSSRTPLIDIPNINFITGIPLDYLHAVCLGVVRTLMNTWILQGSHQCKFPASVTFSLSTKLISLSSYNPCEFNRKPRSLIEIKRWKGTEFRQFLLYTGPVILKLDECMGLNKGSNIYSHFLSLSIAMFILLSPNFCLKYQQYAKELLLHFVTETKSLYGMKYLTHNFHCLTHIADHVTTFGPLDNCSAFKYENFLQFFKKRIRKGSKPLQQIVRRLSEIMESDYFKLQASHQISEPGCLGPHSDGPVLNCDPLRQYHALNTPTFKLSRCNADSFCYLKNGSVFKIENIAFPVQSDELMIIGKTFECRELFFGQPYIDSSKLGIFLVSSLGSLESTPASEICQEAVALPYKNKVVVFPLIHTQK